MKSGLEAMSCISMMTKSKQERRIEETRELFPYNKSHWQEKVKIEWQITVNGKLNKTTAFYNYTQKAAKNVSDHTTGRNLGFSVLFKNILAVNQTIGLNK